MAGTGTLWAGGVVAGSSLGEGQMGAVASRGPEERMVTQFGGSGGGKVTVESQLSPSLFWKPPRRDSSPTEREVDEAPLQGGKGDT